MSVFPSYEKCSVLKTMPVTTRANSMSEEIVNTKKCYKDMHYIPAREITAKTTYRFDKDDCPYCEIERLKEESEGWKHNYDMQQDVTNDLQAKLSRYEGAVAVKGTLERNPWGIRLLSDVLTKYNWQKGQKVTVLVMVKD